MNKLTWWLIWIVANGIGFTLGELLGGRSGVPKLVSEATGLTSGSYWSAWSLVYGLTFGTIQALVLHRRAPSLNRLAWAVATAIGFAAGTTLGARPSFAFVPNLVLMGVVYGIVVGGCLGLTQWRALTSAVPNAIWWVPATLVVWIVGETTAFIIGFGLRNTPIVGIVIGTISGLFLLVLWPAPPARPQLKTVESLNTHAN